MRVPVPMPKINYEMEFGIVASWHVAIGDTVKAGQVIADIETEKAVVGLESPAEGTLVAIVSQPGDEVPALEPIAWIETGG
jgi:pyruvate/2-oxoglutarate dehydrogenase complex dihydrolipoamide acyltransferase (E2) component